MMSDAPAGSPRGPDAPIFEVMRTMRAMRRLKPDPVPDDVIARIVDAGVRAVLELQDTLEAWAGDTTQSDAGERGRAALRRMIVRLGELARTGAREPREVIGGYVEALLAERAAARDDRRFRDADRVRDVLAALGVEVRDTRDGTEWAIEG